MSSRLPDRPRLAGWRIGLKTPSRAALLLVGGLALADAMAAAPVTTNLPAAADTTLRHLLPNQNFGGDDGLRVGWSKASRSLVRFDTAAVVATVGSGTLVSAHLELYVEGTFESLGLVSQDVAAHRVTAAWTEAGATWNCAIDTRPGDIRADCNPKWNGGTFAATATATAPHNKNTAGYVRWNVTADVAAFLAGTANQGWLLKKANELALGRIDYASREGAAARRPRLVLVVEPGGGGDATPPSVAIAAPAEGGLLATATPEVTATYSDAGSGIDPASARLTVDGVDRTAEAVATATGLSWTPTAALAEGAHAAAVSVRDLAGNLGSASRTFSTDTVLPTLAILSPAPGRSVGANPPSISLQYADLGTGLDLPTVSIKVDGVAVAGCTVGAAAATCSVPSLAPGEHTLAVALRDRAGNPASGGLGFDFVRDLAPPSIAIVSPADGQVGRTAAVLVTGTVADDSGVEVTVAVNGQPATVEGGGFSVFVPLAEGANEIVATATDVAERQASVAVSAFLDTLPPTLAVASPEDGAVTNASSAHVAGSAADGVGLDRVTVAGSPVPVSLGTFAVDVPLAEGANSIEVRARDLAGNERALAIDVERFSLPTVEITAPADLATIAATTVEVRGTVDPPGSAVAVNGLLAAVSGGTFVVSDVPLIEGGNQLSAVANATGGRVGTATVHVVRDLTPPHVSIDLPRAGAVLSAPTVTVGGLVNDLVAGTVNAAEAEVTVNGLPATVANRSFVVAGVPLAPGDNTLTAEATDESGNVTRTSIVVFRDGGAVPRIATVSGDGQSGVIRTELASPLTVRLTDAAGLPVAGRTVLWKTVGSDGRLDGGAGPGRQAISTSGPDGLASARFTLGSRAGAGNQVVEAIASGFFGPATFSASAMHGPATRIVVDAGDQQEGATGQLLPRPLVAAVIDDGANRVSGVAVRFEVAKGGGRFANGERAIELETDGDGRAVVPFWLDDAEGVANNVVNASIVGQTNGPLAGFVATGRTGGVADTTLSGIVLDNSNQPVAGATLRILGSPLSTVADAKGLFKLTSVPVGTVKLIVDGSTVARPGSWPDLEFVMNTIPGRDNTLGMPIFLLPLDLSHGIPVDETRGGRISLPEVPGFALDVEPGSVTFPGGSRSGFVSVTAVHSDKVPMVPNFGQQPRLIVTIQPAGARFDPPARLTLPNVEGYAPGQVTEFYSFDHDLGHFVSIGPATVSDDGATIVSNRGVGIVKAGWHCGGNPGGSGTTHACPECQRCVNNSCAPVNSGTCDDHDMCTINDRCQNGTCRGDAVTVTAINGNCVAAVNQALSLTAASNAPAQVKWQAPSGNPSMGMGGTFSVTYSSEGDFTVTAMCAAASQTKRVSTGPTCASITPRLVETPEATGSPVSGAFGAVVPGTTKMARYKGCVGGGTWCFRLEEYKELHSFWVSGGNGRINVSGPNDAVVTPTTCATILADLTPPPVGTASGPPRASYWSQSITTAHERFHVGDVHNRITQRVFSDLTAFVSQASHCTTCKSTAPTSTFDMRMNQLFTQYFNAMAGNAEQLAHDHSNAMYRTLISGIRARARAAPASAGWPATCK